jgi:hypothetical protein
MTLGNLPYEENIHEKNKKRSLVRKNITEKET